MKAERSTGLWQTFEHPARHTDEKLTAQLADAIAVAEEAVNNISSLMLKPPSMNSHLPIHRMYS